MRKIALRGMAGRRRDTLLLGGVVTLAIIPVSGGDYLAGTTATVWGSIPRTWWNWAGFS